MKFSYLPYGRKVFHSIFSYSTRGNDSTQNAIEVLQESFTIEGAFDVVNKIDETIMEVPYNHNIETDDTTTTALTTTEDSTTTTSDATTTTPTTTTAEPTTINPLPSEPKCVIINSTNTPPCTVTCTNVTKEDLQSEISSAIDNELPVS